MTEKLCTIREASEILAVTEGTIRGWIQVGRLPVIRLGRAVRLKSGLLDQIQGGICFKITIKGGTYGK